MVIPLSSQTRHPAKIWAKPGLMATWRLGLAGLARNGEIALWWWSMSRADEVEFRRPWARCR